MKESTRLKLEAVEREERAKRQALRARRRATLGGIWRGFRAIPMRLWGALAVLGMLVAGVALGPTREELAATRAADEKFKRQQRAAAAREREAACTDRVLGLTRGTVTAVESGDIFVDPLRWADLTFQARKQFALFCYVCFSDGNKIRIRHGNTGGVLATYDPDDGFEPGG